jgi:hypothetical protein
VLAEIDLTRRDIPLPINGKQKNYLPYGESPTNVSVETSPGFLSRVLTIVTSWIWLIVMLVSFDTEIA